jgi:hypothetical protein
LHIFKINNDLVTFCLKLKNKQKAYAKINRTLDDHLKSNVKNIEITALSDQIMHAMNKEKERVIIHDHTSDIFLVVRKLRAQYDYVPFDLTKYLGYIRDVDLQLNIDVST